MKNYNWAIIKVSNCGVFCCKFLQVYLSLFLSWHRWFPSYALLTAAWWSFSMFGYCVTPLSLSEGGSWWPPVVGKGPRPLCRACKPEDPTQRYPIWTAWRTSLVLVCMKICAHTQTKATSNNLSTLDMFTLRTGIQSYRRHKPTKTCQHFGL